MATLQDLKNAVFNRINLRGSIQDKEQQYWTIASASPIVLSQSAVPVILVPNGTVATNGTITLGTALPTTYSGGAWIRLPAGAVVGGLAGLYWCVFSSTTVGVVKTLFADPATAFIPYVPTVALVTATGSNAAYTQTTGADITLANITIPGGLMGLNGAIRLHAASTGVANVNAKSVDHKLGGVSIGNYPYGSSASVVEVSRLARNRGSSASQFVTRQGVLGDFTNASFGSMYITVNTAVDQALTCVGQIAVATDYIVLEAFTVEVIPA